jgi:hypothetical protein
VTSKSCVPCGNLPSRTTLLGRAAMASFKQIVTERLFTTVWRTAMCGSFSASSRPYFARTQGAARDEPASHWERVHGAKSFTKERAILEDGVAVKSPGIIYLQVCAKIRGPGNLPGLPPNDPAALKALQLAL